MNTRTKRMIGGWVLIALLAGGIAVMLAPPAPAEDDAPPLKILPTTTRLSDEDLADLTEQDSIGPRRPEFSQEEWVVLDKPWDGLPSYDNSAFYVLLEHVMSDIDPGKAFPVNAKDLLAQPLQYRGRPVKIELKFKETHPFRPIRSQPYESLHSTSGFVRLPNEALPVYVISPFAPPAMDDAGKFEVVGYFHMLLEVKAPNSRDTVLVPVIIARQIISLDSPTQRWDSGNMLMIAAVIGLIVLYIIVRVRLSKRDEAKSTYRPRRFELTPEQDKQSRVDIDSDKPGPPRDQPK